MTDRLFPYRWTGKRLHRRCGPAERHAKRQMAARRLAFDADWLRDALRDNALRACIPDRNKRDTPAKYDKRRYKRRSRIEIMFGRLKNWRRVATRYVSFPKVFLSAIALAALVI